jgi:hypothetical protein
MAIDGVSGINFNQNNTADTASGFDAAVSEASAAGTFQTRQSTSDATPSNDDAASVETVGVDDISETESIGRLTSSLPTGPQGYLGFGFAPAALLTEKVLSKLWLTAMRKNGITTPPSKDEMTSIVNKLNPVIQALINAGVDPSKVIKLEFNFDMPLAGGGNVIHIKLDMNQLRNLNSAGGGAGNIATTVIGMMAGWFTTQSQTSFISLVQTAMASPINGLKDIRVSWWPGDSARFGAMSYASIPTGVADVAPFLSTRIFPDGTRQLIVGVEASISRNPLNGVDFPASIFAAGGGYYSIKINPADIVQISGTQNIGIRTTVDGRRVVVELPQNVAVMLGLEWSYNLPEYKSGKVYINDVAVETMQTEGFDAMVQSMMGSAGSAFSDEIRGNISKLSAFLGLIDIFTDPVSFLKDKIIGRDPADVTYLIPGRGRVINTDATPTEEMRILVRQLISGDPAEYSRVVETFLDRYIGDREQFGKPALTEQMKEQFRLLFKNELELSLDPEKAFLTATGVINGSEANFAEPGVGNDANRIRVWVATYPGADTGSWQWLYRAGPDGGANPPDNSGNWVWLGFKTVEVEPGTSRARTGYVAVWGNLATGENRLVEIAQEGVKPDDGFLPVDPSGVPIDPSDLASGEAGYLRVSGGGSLKRPDGTEIQVRGGAVFLDGRGGWFFVQDYAGVWNGDGGPVPNGNIAKYAFDAAGNQMYGPRGEIIYVDTGIKNPTYQTRRPTPPPEQPTPPPA